MIFFDGQVRWPAAVLLYVHGSIVQSLGSWQARRLQLKVYLIMIIHMRYA